MREHWTTKQAIIKEMNTYVNIEKIKGKDKRKKHKDKEEYK